MFKVEGRRFFKVFLLREKGIKSMEKDTFSDQF